MREIVLDLLCHADFSGRIRPSREDIGFPAFSAEIARLRAQNPAGTLLLDAGDAFADFAGPLGHPSEFVKMQPDELRKRRYLFVAGGVGAAPV